MLSKFTQHPAEQGETYFQHLSFAFWFSLRMGVGAVAVIIHGVFPFLFEKTGTRAIRDINWAIENRKADKLFRD